MSDAIILKLKEEEENCLEDLPRRIDARLCTVKDTDKTLVGKTGRPGVYNSPYV